MFRLGLETVGREYSSILCLSLCFSLCLSCSLSYTHTHTHTHTYTHPHRHSLTSLCMNPKRNYGRNSSQISPVHSSFVSFLELVKTLVVNFLIFVYISNIYTENCIFLEGKNLRPFCIFTVPRMMLHINFVLKNSC